MSTLLKNCLFTAAALGMSALPSLAGVTAKVPFDFTAGTVKLPAGVYNFEETDNGLLVISGVNSRSVNFVSGAISGSIASNSAVKFEKTGSEYRLSRVTSANETTSLLLPVAHKGR